MSRIPAFPVVLCHGLFGTQRYGVGPLAAGDYFRGIRQHLAQLGVQVITPRVHPTAGVHRRVWMLAQRIRATCGTTPFHIIGHSMGGLDMRLLATDPAWTDQIISMTSIGTPHLGTSLADLAERHLHLLFRGMETAGWSIDGFRQVSSRCMPGITGHWQDPPFAACRSIAGNPDPNPGFIPLRPLHRLIHAIEGPNDGLVPMESALGWGEPLPPWPFDHLAQINWMTSRQTSRLVIDHYVNLVEELTAIEAEVVPQIMARDLEPQLQLMDV